MLKEGVRGRFCITVSRTICNRVTSLCDCPSTAGATAAWLVCYIWSGIDPLTVYVRVGGWARCDRHRFYNFGRRRAARIADRHTFKAEVETMHFIHELCPKRLMVHVGRQSADNPTGERAFSRDHKTRRWRKLFRRTGDRCARRPGTLAETMRSRPSPGGRRVSFTKAAVACLEIFTSWSANQALDDAHDLPKAWPPTRAIQTKRALRSAPVVLMRGVGMPAFAETGASLFI